VNREGWIPVKLDGKLIGEIRPDGLVYVTHRWPQHYFRKFQGFGISKDVINYLNRAGVKKIVVCYHSEKPQTWQTGIAHFLSKANTYINGNDFQYILHKDDWCIREAGEEGDA
jgi:hypothetical protein